jgi:transcriptional regulator with XRE-family HTH domain
MRDPAFVAALAERDPVYQVARLRILRGLTQEQLAELVGTKQSSIARLERGRTSPNLSFLRKVAAALGARVEVRLTPVEEPAPAGASSVPQVLQSLPDRRVASIEAV